MRLQGNARPPNTYSRRAALLVVLAQLAQRLRVSLLFDGDVAIVLFHAAAFPETGLRPGDQEFPPVLADQPRVFDAQARFGHDVEALGVDQRAADFTGPALLGHAISFPGN